MQLDDVRKTIEAAVSNITPNRAQELAKGLLDPGAAKEQVAKTAADLLEWSHRSRERVREMVRHEIQEQMRGVGIATQADVDALRKRVRELERGAGMTASGGRTSGAKRRSSASSTRAKATGSTSRAKTTRTSSRAKASTSKRRTSTRTTS